MGQIEILKEIENLGFTTLEELKGKVGFAERSITHSLSKLVRWKEVKILNFGQRRIYFSEEFFSLLTNETETLD